MSSTTDVKDRLDEVLPGIRAGAAAVDSEAAFPADQVRSLGDAGLLGLASTFPCA